MKIIPAIKCALLLAPVCLLSLSAGSQTLTVKKPRVRLPPPMERELSGGFGLTSTGWKAFVDYGQIRSDEGRYSDQFHNVRLYQLEFAEVKHPKETRVTSRQGSNPGEGKTKPYIFGKINNFYTLNLSYGRRKMIAGKPEPKSVSIHWVYAGGLSLGMLKPYYLEDSDEKRVLDNASAVASKAGILMKCCRKRNAVSPVRIGKFCCTSLRRFSSAPFSAA